MKFVAAIEWYPKHNALPPSSPQCEEFQIASDGRPTGPSNETSCVVFFFSVHKDTPYRLLQSIPISALRSQTSLHGGPSRTNRNQIKTPSLRLVFASSAQSYLPSLPPPPFDILSAVISALPNFPSQVKSSNKSIRTVIYYAPQEEARHGLRRGRRVRPRGLLFVRRRIGGRG